MTDHRDRPSHAEILRGRITPAARKSATAARRDGRALTTATARAPPPAPRDSVTDAVSASAGLTAFLHLGEQPSRQALPDLRGRLPPHAIDQRPPDIRPIVARNPRRAARQLKRAAAPDEARWRRRGPPRDRRAARPPPRRRDRRARSNGGSRTIARGSGRAPSSARP